MMLMNIHPMFGRGGGSALNVADVFSTDLYTGDITSRSITNGVNLSAEGGLVWIKRRDTSTNHTLFNTSTGAETYLRSDTTGATNTVAGSLTAFNADGFDLGTSTVTNASAGTYAAWTFRRAPKFFDVVTYTGDGTAGRTIAHNLGSVPGMIVLKVRSTTSEWVVRHESASGALYLNLTDAAIGYFVGVSATSSTDFTVTNDGASNGADKTYVAYLFAHDTDPSGIIQCGSYTTDASGNATITLGWEPQWVLWKSTTSTLNWYMHDTLRGMPIGSPSPILFPNTSGAEISGTLRCEATSTGFNVANSAASATVAFMAIRKEGV